MCKNFIAFVNEGKLYCLNPGGEIVELGKGSYPKLIAACTAVLCVWQNEGRIYYSIVDESNV